MKQMKKECNLTQTAGRQAGRFKGENLFYIKSRCGGKKKIKIKNSQALRKRLIDGQETRKNCTMDGRVSRGEVEKDRLNTNKDEWEVGSNWVITEWKRV